MPQRQPSLLAGPLALCAALIVRAPRTVLILCAAGAAFAAVLAWAKLDFRTSRLDLLNPHSAYNQRWLAYLQEFGEEDDAVIVVQAAQPQSVPPVLDELAAEVARYPERFQAVLHKKDFSALRRKGLHLTPPDQLRQLDAFLHEMAPILGGDWRPLQPARMLKRLATAPNLDGRTVLSQQTSSALQSWAASLSAALGPTETYQSPWRSYSADQLDQLQSQRLLTRDGRMGFVLLRVVKPSEKGFSRAESIDLLRRIINDVGGRRPQVQIGLTGMPVLEDDEMRSSQRDMFLASLLSLLAVAVLFAAGFGGLRHPLMTVGMLLVGLAWSIGYITLAVGHLNILSVAFGVILIGLGIDFGIHYVADYLHRRRTGEDCSTALIKTSYRVGPSIVTGAVTTSLAFFTAGLTHFTGIAELGVIAGGGVLCCLLAALVGLPAMIFLGDRTSPANSIPSVLPFHRPFHWIGRAPRATLFVGLGVTLFMGYGAMRLRYDHNLLNLQPARLESVQWEKRLLQNSDQSVWFALSMADNRRQLLERKRLFQQCSQVERVEEIASLLPPADVGRQAIIQRIAPRLHKIPLAPPQLPLADPQQLLGQIERTLQSPGLTPVCRLALEQLRQALLASPRAEVIRRLAKHQSQAAQELLARLAQIRSAAAPAPPTIHDLPPALAARFIGQNGRHLIKVYARGDIWDMEALSEFVNQLEQVDPRITGHPVQTYYASRQMQSSFIHAAIYSLFAVAIVLMLDFRSIRCSLLALTPMALGAVQLFGLLGFLEIHLNPANMIVMPLILGIGIDDGVHVIHDYLRHKADAAQRPPRYRIGPSTCAGVLLTSATTMVGFGMMMFARHQGLRSLGQVLTLGVLCCLFSSVVILPALLSLISGRRRSQSAGEQVVQAPTIIPRRAA